MLVAYQRQYYDHKERRHKPVKDIIVVDAEVIEHTTLGSVPWVKGRLSNHPVVRWPQEINDVRIVDEAGAGQLRAFDEAIAAMQKERADYIADHFKTWPLPTKANTDGNVTDIGEAVQATRMIDGKRFTLVTDRLTHNEALNLAAELRRGQQRTISAHGNTGYKRHLYRIGKVDGAYAVLEYRRNPRQY